MLLTFSVSFSSKPLDGLIWHSPELCAMEETTLHSPPNNDMFHTYIDPSTSEEHVPVP